MIRYPRRSTKEGNRRQGSHAARASSAPPRRTHATTLAGVLLLSGCLQAAEDHLPRPQLDLRVSSLTAAQRRLRAGQIRDATLQSGVTEGYLLAGIAEAETNMSHCWSELTWACQGPASADCGGGPVVAGAGDGPCSDRQGGLGMFQFDAGTYDQTLAREGRRVLSIAGNVAAAVEFVLAMIIRSSYVADVDDEPQAIRWLNGVRIGNERWDAWVRTVTHYYNGCTPQASCWSSRYARYRDTAVRVHDEFGDPFWRVEQTHRLFASYVDQSFPLAREPLELLPGEEEEGYIELRNEGTETWRPGHTFLTVSNPRNRTSPLAASGWVAGDRPATVGRDTARGQSVAFTFKLRAPTRPGSYRQFFTLVHDATWFGDVGGFPDDQLEVWVEVEPAARPEGASGSDAGGPPGAHVTPVPPATSSSDASPAPPAELVSDAAATGRDTPANGLADSGWQGVQEADSGHSESAVRSDGGCTLSASAGNEPSSWSLLLCLSSLLLRRVRRWSTSDLIESSGGRQRAGE